MRLINPNLALTVAGRRVACEVAASDAAQRRGLQGVRLRSGTGMAFVWPGSAVRTFHMGEVAYPIDVGFYDAAGRQVRLARGRPGREEIWRAPACLVLETPAGEQSRTATLRMVPQVSAMIRRAAEEPYLPSKYWPMPTKLLTRGPNDSDDGVPGESEHPPDGAVEIHDPVKRHVEWTDNGPSEVQLFSKDDPLFGDSRGVSMEDDWSQARRGSGERWQDRRSGLAAQALVNAGELIGKWVSQTQSGIDWRTDVTSRQALPRKFTQVVDALGKIGDYDVGFVSIDLLPTSLAGAIPKQDPSGSLRTRGDVGVIAEALLTTEGLRAFSAELLKSGLADIVKSDDLGRELILIKANEGL